MLRNINIFFISILFCALQSCGDKSANQTSSVPLPADEEKFIAVVAQAQSDGKKTENDMQRGGVKAARDKEICALLTNLNINNWIGKIDLIDANSDGKGVLSVEIANNIKLTTWNNALSDLIDQTLIEPGTPLFVTASAMKKGDLVEFSGVLFEGTEGDCVKETSLTLSGKVMEPEFLFKFSRVGKPTVQKPSEVPAAEPAAPAPAPAAAPEAVPEAVPEAAPAPAAAPAAAAPDAAPAADNSPFAPSFDCAKASNGQEKLVCGDRELAKLDVDLSQSYARAKERSADKDKLKKEQMEWIKFSLRACSDKNCLVGSYQKRISELQ